MFDGKTGFSRKGCSCARRVYVAVYTRSQFASQSEPLRMSKLRHCLGTLCLSERTRTSHPSSDAGVLSLVPRRTNSEYRAILRIWSRLRILNLGISERLPSVSQVSVLVPGATLRELGLVSPMDEGRKRVLGIMAAILAARKLAQFDGGARVPATICAIDDSIRWAEEILRAIDERWPSSR